MRKQLNPPRAEDAVPPNFSTSKPDRQKLNRRALCEAQGWRCAFCNGPLRWVPQERGSQFPDDAAVALHLTTRLHLGHGLEPGRKVAACWSCAKLRSAELLASMPLEELHDRAQATSRAEQDKPLRVPRPRDEADELEARVSLRVHQAAVAAARADPELVDRARKVLTRWRNPMNRQFEPIWQVWEDILDHRDWARVLDESEAGWALRRHHSPLAALLPRSLLESIAKEVRQQAAGQVGTAGEHRPPKRNSPHEEGC